MENNLLPKDRLCLKPSSLRKTSDFDYLRESGRRLTGADWMLVNFLSRDSEELRFGFTIGKKVGTAVVRNRLKRWGREYFRKNKKNSFKGVDLNIIFRPMPKGFYGNLDFHIFEKTLDRAVDKVLGLAVGKVADRTHEKSR